MLMRMRQSIELDAAFGARRKGRITTKLDELASEIQKAAPDGSPSER